MMGIFRLALFAWLVLSPLAIILAAPNAAHAQASGWAPVQSIPGYEQDNLPPYMVADQNNTVHAFTTQNFGDRINPERVIVYSSWRQDRGWSYPIDILASPIRNQARIHGAFLDNAGYIHVVFFGGDDRGAEIFYSKAPAISAANSQAWMPPRSIGVNAITPNFAALVGDGDGTLVMVYSSDVDRVGLYEVHSIDGGESWSEPDNIFLTFSNQWQPSDLNMYMGETGRVHVVWNVTDQRGDNVAGYYTNADIGLWSWLEPFELDENRELGVAIPNVIEHQNAVWIIYNNGIWDQVAPVQWTRVSYDGGLSWSNPMRPFPDHVGRNGTIAFAKDSREQLHLMFGQRYFKEGENVATHGMWYSTRRNENWIGLSAVVEGRSEVDETSELGFDPYDARAVVSQGNFLLLTWRTDPGLSRDGVWYTYRRLDAPSLPVVPLPEPQATPTATPFSIAGAVAPVERVVSNNGAEQQETVEGASGEAASPLSPIALTETAIAIAQEPKAQATPSNVQVAAANTENERDQENAFASGQAADAESEAESASEDTSEEATFANLPPPSSQDASPATALLFGIIPAAIFICLMVFVVRYFQKRRTF